MADQQGAVTLRPSPMTGGVGLVPCPAPGQAPHVRLQLLQAGLSLFFNGHVTPPFCSYLRLAHQSWTAASIAFSVLFAAS